jgi:hypothetical protein
MLVGMTTNEYVYTRPVDAEDVLSGRDWSADTETSRAHGSVRHAHRADFVERAAMSRERHRL